MPAASGGTPKRRVLIVDDDRTTLEAMEAALEREFHVFAAPDIATATYALARETIDLVILDVVLDEESGLDFLARLRETSDIPVLLISGYGTKDMLIAGLRARASDYLDKPFSATQLLERARNLIAQGPRPSDISDRVRSFILEHYARDWTVESMAKELRLSVRTMRQTFRQRYRRSVIRFLEEVRVSRARELLATTDLSIHKIAAEVGFRDPHYLGRVFRREVGQRPRDFRIAQRREPVNETPPSA